MIRGILCGLILYALTCVFATIRASALESALDACAPYRDEVVAILADEGVDDAYFFLMVAESRCRIGAESEAGAQGFWQMMPGVARHYGCNNPHDLECATRAAARYIRHLESSFTRFDDVIMAYNQGGHNLRRYGATREARGLAWAVRKLRAIDDAG